MSYLLCIFVLLGEDSRAALRSGPGGDCQVIMRFVLDELQADSRPERDRLRIWAKSQGSLIIAGLSERAELAGMA
jgi:hypothetical protein